MYEYTWLIAELLLNATGADNPSGSESSDDSEFGLEGSAQPSASAGRNKLKTPKQRKR